jgi:hypothetical protein
LVIPLAQMLPFSVGPAQPHPCGQTGQQLVRLLHDPLQQSAFAVHGALVAPLQAPPQQVRPAGQPVTPQTPAVQVAARQGPCGTGQSAAVRQRQVWRPAASAAQRRAQQSAFSRQRSPGVRQATASARSRPAIPTAAAASPARRRRRLPGTAMARAKLSNRSASIAHLRADGIDHGRDRGKLRP